MRDHSAKGSDHTIPALDRQFHFLFYDRCGNSGLTADMELLCQQWPWDLLYVIEQRARSAPAEHQAIIDAAHADDIEVVARATEEHLSANFRELATHLTGVEPLDPFNLDNDCPAEAGGTT